jgi:hypothetical protein
MAVWLCHRSCQVGKIDEIWIKHENAFRFVRFFSTLNLSFSRFFSTLSQYKPEWESDGWASGRPCFILGPDKIYTSLGVPSIRECGDRKRNKVSIVIVTPRFEKVTFVRISARDLYIAIKITPSSWHCF